MGPGTDNGPVGQPRVSTITDDAVFMFSGSDVAPDEIELHCISEAAEKNLQALYQNKCVFKVNQNEVERIRSFTESSVHALLEHVVRSKEYLSAVGNEKLTSLSLYETVYVRSNLLKVGSFYEGTKNNYPDEFDFIFLIGECDMSEYDQAKKQISQLSDKFHEVLQRILQQYAVGVAAGITYKGLHGPASKLQLRVPECADQPVKFLDVDVSVACRVKIQTYVHKDLTINFKGWDNIIKETGSFLIMKVYKVGHPKHKTSVQLTVTEAEQRYTKTTMSDKHRQIYRVLKVFFNGNDGNEELKKLIRVPTNKKISLCFSFRGRTKVMGPRIVCDFPSYAVKSLIFGHEQFCKDDDPSIAKCTLQILGGLLTKFKVEIERFSSMWSERMCSKPFSVRIDKAIGAPLEITDDYESSAVIAETLAEMIDDLQTQKEPEHSPLTGQAADLVKSVMQKQKERFMGRPLCIAILLIFGIAMLAVIPLIYIKARENNLCSYDATDVYDNSDVMLYKLECEAYDTKVANKSCGCLWLPLDVRFTNVPVSLQISCVTLTETTLFEFTTHEIDGHVILSCPSYILLYDKLPGCFNPTGGLIGTGDLEQTYFCDVLQCPSGLTDYTNYNTGVLGIDLCCTVKGGYSLDRQDDCLDGIILSNYSSVPVYILYICGALLILIVPIRFWCYKRNQINRVKKCRRKIDATLKSLQGTRTVA